MTTQPHVRDLELTLTFEGEEPIQTTYDAIVLDNEMSDEEAEAFAMILLENGEFRGGGGAAPAYTVAIA